MIFWRTTPPQLGQSHEENVVLRIPWGWQQAVCLDDEKKEKGERNSGGVEEEGRSVVGESMVTQHMCMHTGIEDIGKCLQLASFKIRNSQHGDK
ncbi:hypothetical protein M0804_005738 [Polistes exclamans]|nr:hypothetical protein M0804_005738 [Polistes exclamans]